jgi:archaellum biogenesis ATPase FlaH
MFNERFKSLARTPINPNIREAVYAIVLPTAADEEYEILLDEFRKSTFSEEREDLLRGMGYFRDLSVVDRVLALTMSKEVKEQDVSLLSNPPNVMTPHGY